MDEKNTAGKWDEERDLWGRCWIRDSQTGRGDDWNPYFEFWGLFVSIWLSNVCFNYKSSWLDLDGCVWQMLILEGEGDFAHVWCHARRSSFVELEAITDPLTLLPSPLLSPSMCPLFILSLLLPMCCCSLCRSLSLSLSLSVIGSSSHRDRDWRTSAGCVCEHVLYCASPRCWPCVHNVACPLYTVYATLSTRVQFVLLREACPSVWSSLWHHPLAHY